MPTESAVIVREVQSLLHGLWSLGTRNEPRRDRLLWPSRPQQRNKSRPSGTSRGWDPARDARFMQHLCCVLPEAERQTVVPPSIQVLLLAGLRHENLPTFCVRWSSHHRSPFMRTRWRGPSHDVLLVNPVGD